MLTETRAASWREVDGWIADLTWSTSGDLGRAPLVYRGVPDPEHGLESSLSRRGPAFASRERQLLRSFRRHAYVRGRADWSDWEWLAMARHYGLPTRLLDWTFSPLIALHFATLGSPERPGRVWCVDYDSAHEFLPDVLQRARRAEGARLLSTDMLARHIPTIDDFDRSAEGEPFCAFFEPPVIADRIANQSAVFSAMSSPSADFGSWLESHPQCGRVLIVDPDAKLEARRRLDQFGVNERILFPGLGGLAGWLTRYYGGGERPQTMDD